MISLWEGGIESHSAQGPRTRQHQGPDLASLDAGPQIHPDRAQLERKLEGPLVASHFPSGTSGKTLSCQGPILHNHRQVSTPPLPVLMRLCVYQSVPCFIHYCVNGILHILGVHLMACIFLQTLDVYISMMGTDIRVIFVEPSFEAYRLGDFPVSRTHWEAPARPALPSNMRQKQHYNKFNKDCKWGGCTRVGMRIYGISLASVTRRTFGHSGIAVHTWYACPALIKSIWAMAISQHQFYLDRKQSKELTGKLPVEYPLDPGEEPPIVRRRIGTAFKLDEQKILPKGEEAELERLEREFAIQSQITEAARRLASDPNVSKKLKKQRKTSYLNALKKLQEIESAINENRVKSGKKPTQRASLIIDDGNIASEDSSLSDALVLEDEDSQVTSTLSPLQSPHKGLPPRPPSHNRPPPPQSLEGLRQMHYHRNDYDKSPIKPKMWSESSLDEPYEKVKKRSSHSHSSNHKRFPSTGSCAEAGGGSSSLQTSPIRSLPHWNSQCSMPSTPDLRVRSPHYVHSTRSVDLSPTRLHSLALHFRHRSSSLESQGKLLGSENDTGSPDFYTPRTRSSNGSDPMDDCSSCTSHSSSEHYYPAQMNANYSTLAEDSPSKARARQRQRQRAAGALGAANSGSMPNLAARGGGHGVYLHSQSQPSSQYRIKEYPLYVEGGATPVVVRSLESDQEGHYSVKAQFKTSNSYTAGGLFRESWRGGDEGDASRLTPSRSQILRTPSLGREGAPDKGAGRAAVSDELRQWYQRSSASHKEHSRLSHTSSTSSDSGSQYSTSSQSTFVAHSRVTRMPQMCKATSAALPQSQRSSTPSSEIGATPPSSPHHILSWQTGSYGDSCFLDSSLCPELADVQWYGQEKAKPGTLV
ncbi:hypothetical protein FD755_006196 [Muntiacus reevesi]|uniref:Cytohesin Ubiquitin Protein Inducing domain-containing protein n=1 Tax=Muntiacus reevesi TaxID=9886 RepID=A0A5J5MVX7_MUNRE|nr:hypothetical protein FD755_006196 [Muntiacus reevesi]